MLDRREIMVSGMIDDENASVSISKLLFLQMRDSKAPVTLFINSPGGQVTACLAIHDTIEFLEAPVHTHGLSLVSGCALWLLAAGEPGHRSIQPDSWLAIEPTQFGSLEGETAEHARKLNARLAILLASKTVLSEREVNSALLHGRSFTVAEAVEFSLADKVSDRPL